MCIRITSLAITFFLATTMCTTHVSAQIKKARVRPVIAYNHSRLPAPPGMVYIPGGTTAIRYSQSSTDSNSIKKVSLDSYFIDKTEVSNAQYRQFVQWVIDSLAIVQYIKDDSYFKNSRTTNDSSSRRIDWSKVDHKKIFENPDDETRGKIGPMLDEKGKIKKEFYTFNYTFNKASENKKTKLIVGQVANETVNVYPDELIWAKDFPNSQTDILVENYFTSPPYDDYPVVGVTWKQARAYCYWRSITAGSYNNIAEYMKYYHLIYNLPTEAQWVYAAQADLRAQAEKEKEEQKDNAEANTTDSTSATSKSVETVPVTTDTTNKSGTATTLIVDGNESITKDPDSVHIYSDKNGMLSNFKQGEGDYSEDGAAFTVPVMSYAPNDYGVYNMVGNVSEWVLDAYSPSSFAFVSDVNPVLLYDADSLDADPMKRKVVRGGSFVSNAQALSPYARDNELQDMEHSYLGFRCAMQAPNILGKKIATRRKTTTGKRNHVGK